METVGRDKDWAPGSCLEKRYLQSPETQESRDMFRLLADPEQRAAYMEPAIDENGNRMEGRRRLDRILVCAATQSTQVTQRPVFHTGLAALTDHLPVSLVIPFSHLE
eukprot:m.213780 g.213780  ORF g.213780 m.213780 type:complete len:107 (+) comp54043_c0_seq1:973-1293(+)